MMFCTTFLSAPSDEILDGASDLGGCLAPLQCLVLPQDELYGPFSDPAANLRHSERTCVVMGKILLNVGLGVETLEDPVARHFYSRPLTVSNARTQVGCNLRSFSEEYFWLDEVLYWLV